MLFLIENSVIDEKERGAIYKIESNQLFIDDLKKCISLISREGDSQIQLKTTYYSQSLSHFYEKLNEISTQHAKVQKDYDRNLKLFNEKVISQAEFENYEFEYNKVKKAKPL